MRVLFATCVLGVLGAALLPAPPARAWWDGWGRWHPNHYRPPVMLVPPPPVYYPRPYARWIPPHYNRWGQFIPGRWV